MSLKQLGSVVFISIFMVHGNEAATATCEFGPMDGVEGRQLINQNIKAIIPELQKTFYGQY